MESRLPGTAVATAAAVLLFSTLLTGCSDDEAPVPAAESYPEVPEQLHPPRAGQFADPTGVPAGEPIDAVPIDQLPDPDWIQDASEATGIPERALAAYAGAALRAHQLHPGCGIGWNTLAGIGQVESHHGTYGGAEVDDDGRVDPPIVGVALDGSPGLMEIPDTDGGELDGDDEFDRAVGPMQFIPTTWRTYALDGSRSGQADPHQYDDAALTAASYLCQRGGELTTPEGFTDAVLAYNQSTEYLAQVAGAAHLYASAFEQETDEPATAEGFGAP
ncbi:lytic transglycosylase domain-containing protein [Nesterenkonia flava]|uniref:Lytic murein transglycosylase n=1 Tax=Nesterenkonia flava TaxID=469799 RepID=A0ABU1FWS4_9MICC|nr:lytic murein transglycosylase [Nesterenkonia flava]MDR5712702.1 lytic murein transglycosylase [Nesterenkonia flava]